MARIILITCSDPETGKLIVDYGLNENTLAGVPLPCEHPSKLGAHIDWDIGEWVLPDKD